MIASIINRTEVESADVVFLGLPFDRSSGLPGAEHGPRAIRDILDSQLEFYEPITRTSPADHLGIAYAELEGLRKLSVDDMVEQVRSRYDAMFGGTLEAGIHQFPIALGGDHSVSIGIFQAIADRMKPLPTILQIDAHFDLRDTDADFREHPEGKNAHCCVMRRAVELDFPVVGVGMRSFSEDEFQFAESHKVVSFSWLHEDRPSPRQVVDSIPCEQEVYLTIDVDGIDPAHMPATGTPVPGGLSWQYVLQLLQELFFSLNVIAMDIVEVAPPLGKTNLTAYGAAQLAYASIALKFEKQIHSKMRAKMRNNRA